MIAALMPAAAVGSLAGDAKILKNPSSAGECLGVDIDCNIGAPTLATAKLLCAYGPTSSGVFARRRFHFSVLEVVGGEVSGLSFVERETKVEAAGFRGFDEMCSALTPAVLTPEAVIGAERVTADDDVAGVLLPKSGGVSVAVTGDASARPDCACALAAALQ